MAMSWSLIWSYALQYPDSPEQVFDEVNQRLMHHLEGSHFLTCFYAVLDPATGEITYCNAGQPPPYLLQNGKAPQPLARTGPPLGVFEKGSWESRKLVLNQGESLLLYTDGVTDACNADGDFFGMERLVALLEKLGKKPAEAIQDSLLASIDKFVAGEPQYDDTALIVLQHE